MAVAWDVLIWFIWFGIFAVFEGLALTKRVPWTTLSEFAWSIEKIMPVARWVFLVGLAALMVHIVAGWNG